MATITRIRRIANPRRAHVKRSAKGRFVKRSSARRSNVRRAKVKRTHAKRVNHRMKNPVLIELGALNPRKRSKSSVRKRKYRKTSNPRRRASTNRRRAVHHRRRRASNPMMRTRRRHTRRRRNPVVMHRRRRNPMGYSSKNLLEMGTGILIGVAAAKYIPSMLPASMVGSLPATSFTGPLITGGAAFLAGWAASKFLPKELSYGVIAGGVALTLSQVLNVIAPPAVSGPFALAGIGDITSGNYVVPQNPLKQVAMISAPPAASGMGRVGAFRGAFGGRR